MSYWAIHYFEQSQLNKFSQYAYNSLSVSITASIVCVIFALLLHFYQRLNLHSNHIQRSAQFTLRFASLSYAIPGTVLAIGILIPYTFADHQINAILAQLNLSPVGLIFSGSMFALVSAYVIRFSAMALGSIETSLQKFLLH